MSINNNMVFLITVASAVIGSFPGQHVIGGMFVLGVTNPSACLARCSGGRGCYAVDFDISDNTCWLHNVPTACTARLSGKAGSTHYRMAACNNRETPFVLVHHLLWYRSARWNCCEKYQFSWLAKSGEQIINLYKCGIHLEMFKIFVSKYVAIFIIMHITCQIGEQQQNMRQFQIKSLVPHPQIGPCYEQIQPSGWQAQNRYLDI